VTTLPRFRRRYVLGRRSSSGPMCYDSKSEGATKSPLNVSPSQRDSVFHHRLQRETDDVFSVP
jgi:hypothetical protein